MTHKLNRLTALLLAVVMTFSVLLVPVEAASFEDVSNNAWYKGAVDYVSERGWMVGVSETEFAPEMNVTRAMFVTVLSRYAGVDYDRFSSSFEDVSAFKWYTGTIRWAAENGIVEGIGDNMFAPKHDISRQDLCTILYRYINFMGYQIPHDADVTYADRDRVSSYARDAVDFCYEAGLISGFGDGTFRPKDTATRAQVAAILMRLDKILESLKVYEDPMPAQNFENEKAGSMTVSVNAPEGALPTDTEMSVTPVTDATTLTSIQKQVNGNILAAADISFSKDGEELEPAERVEVRISMEGVKDMRNLQVVHRKEDGTIEYVRSDLISINRSGSEKVLRFYASDFSVYAILDSGDAARLMVIFHMPVFNEDGSFSFTGEDQIYYVTEQDIKNNDGPLDENNKPTSINYLDTIIPDPTVPLPEEHAPKFFGWATDAETACRDGAYTDTDASVLADGAHDINAVREHIRATLQYYIDDERDDVVDMFDDQAIHVYPVLYYFYTVSYKEETGASTLDTLAVYSRTREKTVPIYSNYEPRTPGATFDCWINLDDGTTVQNGGSLAIHDNVVLMAKLKEGCYIIFDENPGNKPGELDRYKGATYVAPIWCPNGVVPMNEIPSDNIMKLKGYKFDGWYLKSSYSEKTDDLEEEASAWSGTKYDFSQHQQLDYTQGNVELVAKWKRDNTTYTVIVEVQDPNDAWNKDDADKVYLPYRTLNGTAKTGTTVNLASNAEFTDPARVLDEKMGSSQYYHVNTARSTLTGKIAANGSTTLTVRFDRDVITYKAFKSFKYGYTPKSLVGSTSSSDWAQVPYQSSTSPYYYFNTLVQHYGLVSGQYVKLTLSSSSSSYPDSDKDVRYDSARWKVTDTNASYTASYTSIYVPVKPDNFNGTAAFTRKGLYGGDVEDWEEAKNGIRWYHYDSDSGKDLYQTTVGEFEAPYDTYQTVINYYLRWYYETTDLKHIHTYYMDTDGQWPSDYSNHSIAINAGSFSEHYITGFTLSKIGTNNESYENAFEPTFDAQDRISLWYWSGTPSTGEYIIEGTIGTVYYTRNQYDLKFYVDGVEQVAKTTKVYYGKELSSYEYNPITPGGMLYFDKWYKDEACKEPVDFANDTMPASDLTLYTNLKTRTFRVFLHTGIEELEGTEVNYKWPVMSDDPDDPNYNVPYIEWTDPDQAKCFQVTYGQAISGGITIDGIRRDEAGNEYALLGWYTDPEYTQPFIFAKELLTDDNTYAYDKTDSSNVTDGPDTAPWNKDTTRPWVTRKIDLYAKWRKLLPNAKGIRVQYVGDQTVPYDANNVTEGTNSLGQHDWYDSELYGDGATAIAGTASTPTANDKLFSYWRLQKYVNGAYVDVPDADDGRYYPGNDLTVDSAKAKVEEKAAGQHTPIMVHMTTKAPNCLDDGHTEYFWCSVCSKYFSDAEHTREIGMANAILQSDRTNDSYHNWSEGFISGDEDGVPGTVGHYKLCARCGDTKDQAAHSYTVTTVPATETTDGYDEHVCSVCGHRYRDNVVPATGVHYTVTYTAAYGTAPAEATYVENTVITLPDAEQPEGWFFIGWVEETVDNVTARPETILSGEYTVTKNVTLKALYRYRTNTTGNKIYIPITDNLTDWSGNYLISYATTSYTSGLYFLKGVSGNTRYEYTSTDGADTYSEAGVTYHSDDSNEWLTGATASYIFAIAKDGNYYTLQNSSTGTYVGSYNGYLYSRASYSSSNCRWTLNYSDGTMSVQNDNSSSYPFLTFSTSNKYFMISSNTSSNLIFWREVEEGTIVYTTVIGEVASYTVSASAGANGTVSPASQTVNEGGSAVFTAAPESGYAISAVTVSPTSAGQASWDGNTVTVSNVSANCTVNVSFSGAATHTVTFKPNGASGSDTTQSVTAGQATNLNANPFTRAGYDFTGWNTAADGTGTSYSDGQSVTLSANLTLYAQWEINVSYRLATAPDAGKDYVIVIGSKAVGNVIYQNGHYLTAYDVTVNSDNTVTLSSGLAESTVLWQVGGNASSGWTFYNTALSKYMGLSSDYYLATSDTAVNWVYENGTDLKNDVDPEEYYYFSLKNDYCFTTSKSATTTDHVLLFERVEGYTGTSHSETLSANTPVTLLSANVELSKKVPVEEVESEPVKLVFSEMPESSGINAAEEDLTSEKPAVKTSSIGNNPNPVQATTYVYELATTLESGAQYLIVYGDATSAAECTTMKVMNSYQTAENSGILISEDPTFRDSTKRVITSVTVNNGTISDCEWTLGSGSVSGTVTFVVDGYYLIMSSSSDNKLVASQTTSNTLRRNWTLSKSSSYEFFNLHNNYWHSRNSSYYYYVYYDTTNNGFTNVSSSTGPLVGAPATIYLYKKVELPSYTITFNGNNATSGTMESQEYESGEVKRLTANAFERTGYRFDHWNTAANDSGTSYANNVNTSFTENTTLYAQWVRVHEVTFKDREGNIIQVNGQNTQTVDDGLTATLPGSPVPPAGYRFAGWFTALDGGTEFTEETPVTTDDLVLYPQFEQITEYEVLFQKTDGTVVGTATAPLTGVQFVAPPAAPQPADGYAFSGWAVDGRIVDVYSYDINKDTVFTAIYEKIQQNFEYTVRLRAIYADKIDPKTTHVNWYVNNGTGGHMKSDDVIINSGIEIEDELTYDENGDEIPDLVNVGYTFLGWAKMEEYENVGTVDATKGPVYEETATSPTLGRKIIGYTNLTEEDLWLEWVDEGDGEGGFLVKEHGQYLKPNGQYVATADLAEYFAMIGANERVPYHGLYAVWRSDYFYVFHSATGKLDAVSIPEVKGKVNGELGNGTFDLTKYVTENHLYGGYYKTYGGLNLETENDVTKTVADKIAAAYNTSSKAYSLGNDASVSWVRNADAESPVKYTVDLGGDNASKTGYVEYDGSSDKNGEQKFWTGGKAYKVTSSMTDAEKAAINGKTMVPEAGTVYYLKEVPDAYLQNHVIYVRSYKQNNKIVDVYQLNVIDDAYYAYAGFDVEGTQQTGLTYCKKFTVSSQDWNPKLEITAEHFGGNLENGYLVVKQLGSDFVTAHTNSTFVSKPYWNTLDGVSIDQHTKTYIVNGVPDEITSVEQTFRNFDGTNDKLYFNFAPSGEGMPSWWDDPCKQVAFFFTELTVNGEKITAGQFKVVSQHEGNIYTVVPPAGSWDKMVLLRVGTDCQEENYWLYNKNRNAEEVPYDTLYNQTGDIAIPTDETKDYLTGFYERTYEDNDHDGVWYAETGKGNGGTWDTYTSN